MVSWQTGRHSDEEAESASSSIQARKRKRRSSSSSDSSSGDRRPRKSATNGSEGSHRNRAIKRSQATNGHASSQSATKPSAASKGKGRAATSSSDSEDESEDEIFVASSKSSAVPSIVRPSPVKPIVEEREEKKKLSRHVRIVQELSDDEDEVASKTSSLKSSKASSAKSSSSNSRKPLTNGASSRHSGHDRVKSKNGSTPSASPKSHKSSMLEEYNFISNKPPSPSKPENGASSGAATDAQESVRNKRLQNQIVSLKQRWDECEDRFNEASSRCETLQADLKQLELELRRSKKAHEENVGKMKERMEGSGDVRRLAQAQIDEYEHKLMIVNNRHDEAMISLQRELERAQREAQAAQKQLTAAPPSWVQRQQTEQAARATELERLLQEQKEEYKTRIDTLEREAVQQRSTAQLSAKEREIEAIQMSYAQELEKQEERYNRLKTMHAIEKQVWTSSNQQPSENNGIPPSEDVVYLQKLVSKLTKQKSNYEIHFQATMDTYEARIGRIQKDAAACMARDKKQINLLESARTTLDFDRAKFQGQVASLKRERETLQKEISNLRKFRPEYDKLRQDYPKLQSEMVELKKALAIALQENDAYRKERITLTSKNKLMESKMDEYIALLQVGNHQDSNDTELLQRYSLLKSTYSMDRQKYKRKIKKLERKLAGSGVPDQEGSLKAAAIHSMSDDEASDSGPAVTNGRQRHDGHDQNGDLEVALFDDTITASSTFSRRPPLMPRRRSSSPLMNEPPKTDAYVRIQEELSAYKMTNTMVLRQYEAAKPAYRFPPTLRERKADTKVPRHRSRVYVRSECHTPYVPDEMVSDSDDEFLEWESQAYAKSQASNPDRKAALVNTCWNRHILDFRCNRVRSTNLHFCMEFVDSYGPLIHSRHASEALLKHILKLVDLGQLTVDEGGSIIRAYHQAV